MRIGHVFIYLTSLYSVTFAQPQQSTNFQITKSVLDGGGGASSSANFRLVSAFGQPSPVGIQSSANFSLSGGFLTPTFTISPLSLIQQLVIKYNSPNIRLDWEHIPDATVYKVFRDTLANFTPGSINQIGTVVDTFFVDNNALALPKSRYYYNVESSHAVGLQVMESGSNVPVYPAKSEITVKDPGQALQRSSAKQTKKRFD